MAGGVLAGVGVMMDPGSTMLGNLGLALSSLEVLAYVEANPLRTGKKHRQRDCKFAATTSRAQEDVTLGLCCASKLRSESQI